MKLNIKHTSGKVEKVHFGKLKDAEAIKDVKGKVDPVRYGKLTEHGKKI